MRVPALLTWGAAVLSSLSACRTDYAHLPTFSTDRKLLQVVVVAPAGTNHEQRYDADKKEFVPVQLAGADHLLEFLPFPGNYGFIPSTRLPTSTTRPGNPPLAALVLAESEPAGTVMEVLPVALLLLDVNGELEQVVVSVPARPAQQILPHATDWSSLRRRYPAVRQSLNLWFQNRSRPGSTRIVGWKDEQAAAQQIKNLMD